MSQQIYFDVKPESQSPYYGTLVVSNIRREGNDSFTVNKFLGVVFQSPVSVSSVDFYYSTDPWVEITPDITSSQINHSRFLITVKLQLPDSYQFNAKEVLTFGINGDITTDPGRFTQTFMLAADQIPSGTVNIDCAPADEALKGYGQVLTLTQGDLVIPITITPGAASTFQILCGTYTVAVTDLSNQDQTVVAIPQLTTNTISVVNGQETTLGMTYGSINKYSAIDVTVGNISPLQGEKFHVTLLSSGQIVADFWSPANCTTPLRRLLPFGTIDISVDPIALNNVLYSFDSQTFSVEHELHAVGFIQADRVSAISDSDFVKLSIVVKTDLTLDASNTVRLVGPSPEMLTYTQQVEIKSGTTIVSVPVAPGCYTLRSPSFIQSSTVYVVDAPTTLTVGSEGTTTLTLEIMRGANLKVPGFPDFLSFGGITDLTDGNEADFVSSRASSIFKYAGHDGVGDPSTYLDKDPATVNTIKLAYNVSQKLGSPVLPVLISYTCNLSSRDFSSLQDEDRLAHGFANLILSLQEADETIETCPVPAVGYILNPDFIGACQQSRLTEDYEMPVRKPLQAALDHWKAEVGIPDSIPDTLRGYVLAVNWLMRTIAPALSFTVTFGWQVSLWGVGSSQWIYEKEVEPATMAKKTATYVTSLGMFDSTHHPDFLAVDRFEADDFTYRAYDLNGYCFGPYEWPRFFDFCKFLSVNLRVPVMPWQIPSSHTPLVTDEVADDSDSQHWGTGGSYILGDSGLNFDNINSKILAIKFGNAYMGETVEEMFRRGEPFDWTKPAYLDFPSCGIFAVLLGGGQTTGIVSSIGNAGPWVVEKLNKYMDNPVPFDDTVGSY